MRLVFLLSLVLLSTILGFSQPSSPKNISPITIKAIPYPCTLVAGPAEVQVLSENSFLLTAPQGTDLHNPASGVWQKSNAPKILFRPTGDFDFSAKVAPSYQNLYDGGALLFWTDAGNWAKVLLQNTGNGSVVGLSVVENALTDDSYYPVGTARDVFFRLLRKGKVSTFYLSTDGTTWTVLRQFVYHRPAPLQVGFYAQSPKGPACEVTFSHISFKEVK